MCVNGIKCCKEPEVLVTVIHADVTSRIRRNGNVIRQSL
jgi:hypothetical protein